MSAVKTINRTSNEVGACDRVGQKLMLAFLKVLTFFLFQLLVSCLMSHVSCLFCSAAHGPSGMCYYRLQLVLRSNTLWHDTKMLEKA